MIPAVKRAIVNAVKCYEAQRYWFNTTATALACSAGQSYVSVPSDFQALDLLEIAYSGIETRLIEEPHSRIRVMNNSSATGLPTHFTYYRDRFELAVIPDSAYSVNCYYLQLLPALSADTDTNVWTNEAQNLIVHSAMVDVLSNTLVSNDPRKLQAHLNSLQMAQKELHLRNSSRLTRKLTPTTF